MLNAEDVETLRHIHPIRHDPLVVQKSLHRALIQAKYWASAPENQATSYWKALETRIQKVIEVTQPSDPRINEEAILICWQFMMSEIENIRNDDRKFYDEWRRSQSQKK